jgi:Flp pilus assembly protein TadG
LVFITLMIVLLMVMVGMGLDTGYLAFSRSMGQRAVDMAALAAAAGLAEGDVAAIKSDIEQLNATNDYVKSSGNVIDGTVDPGSGVGKNVTLVNYDKKNGIVVAAPVPLSSANAVRVGLEAPNHNPFRANSNSAINTPAFLTPLINLFGGGASAAGANDVNVSAMAVASAYPSLPIALGGCDRAWESETTSDINFNQVSSGQASAIGANNSGWTTYFDPSTSTPDLITLVHKVKACQGSSGVIPGVSNICLGNGQNSPVLQAFGDLVDPSGNTCYLAPVIDPTAVFNQCNNLVNQLALICIKAICAQGNNAVDPGNLCPKKVTSQYLKAKVKSCKIDPNKMGQGSCYSLRLVRERNVGM